MSITIIGAGNLGFHLAQGFAAVGVEVSQVFSRNKLHAEDAAKVGNAEPINEFSQLNTAVDYYLLAVSDGAIIEVAAQLNQILPDNAFIAHTSGATPSSVLAKYFKRFGVFYPLQSFSKEKSIDFTTVPFCIHAANEEDKIQLEQLARQLSPKVYRVDDEQRAILHVAAVFANNFTNHLFQTSYQLLKEHTIPFELLFPIIDETIQKIKYNEPALMQTGPAIRGDEATLKRHLDLLTAHPNFQEIYTLLSQNINPKLKL